MNSKGDIIIEYSYDQYRLFYGLRGNGTLYFSEGTKEIEIISDTINSNILKRYESINFFVSFMDDINKENEYLMSISSYITILELHDFQNDQYSLREATNFVDKPAGIYSYIFQVLEAKINSQIYYFLIHIYKIGNNNDQYNYKLAILKFRIPNFDLNAIIEDGNENVENTPGNRISSSVIITQFDLLALFYMNVEGYFCASLYDYNLQSRGDMQLDRLATTVPETHDGVFFKSVYLYVQYIAFIYFVDAYHFRLNILLIDRESYNSYTLNRKLDYSDNNLSLNSEITMNEFLKVNKNRLVLISTQDYTTLYIILFDLYINVYKIKVRYYHYNFVNDKISKLDKEITGLIYNGFLMFTATVLPSAPNANNDNFFPILLMFGYPNGTDSEINITNFFMDTGNYNSINNLYYYLIRKVEMDNNIFSYQLMNQIKLVSIPDEILFFNGSNNSSISNNQTIDANYILKQNMNLLKEYKDYYLHYQYLVKEPEYSDVYGNYAHEVKGDNDDLKLYYTPEILGGRINELKFKLCYGYCNTCKKTGFNVTEQNCETCLDDFSFYNSEGWNKKCVPQGYFYDNETNSLVKCTTENSKFYFDVNRHKRICFQNNYECPSEYSNYNIETRECIYNNKPNNGAINTIIDNELNNYTISSPSLEMKGENNTIFQLTTSSNELERLTGNVDNENGVSVIDLGNCENLLKQAYDIDNSTSLIIKKYEVLTNAAERNVQYEVYHPITKEKLNLSICASDTISLYIPVTLDDNTIKLYENLKSAGYDLFNINDPFYNDICSPYDSENGTDVLLSDRKNDYYNNNNDNTTCQSNCKYSSFDSKYLFLKCECKVVVDDINVEDFDKFSQKIYENFYDILVNSNYKTMKCYNLVFNLKYFKKNIGSIIILIFFGIYLILLIIYIIKGISPLHIEALKTLDNKFKNTDINNIVNIVINSNINVINIDNSKNKIKKKKNNFFPPKKKKTKIKTEDGLIDFENEKQGKGVKFKRKKYNNDLIVKSISTNKISINDKKGLMTETKKSILEFSDIKKIKSNKKHRRKDKNKINDTSIKDKNNIFDDLDFNCMPYEKAADLDKRTFLQNYWSKLKLKHLIIYTFISKNDYNLIYIKLTRFIFLICTSMALNVMFFFDSSMHKIYLDYGKYNFIQQIPQIIYSSLVSLIMEILIGLLSYTHVNIYYIRQLEELNMNKVKKIFKVIKIKIIIFYVVILIFLAFYWYLISSFCAVYNNTQIIYLKDFATSFSLGLLYPFIIQLFLAFLRMCSLKKKTKFRSFIYKFC